MKKRRIFSLFIIITAIAVMMSVFASPAAAYTPSSFEVNAPNALLISMDGNSVLFERGADEKVSPAALVKIMTAVMIIEKSPDIKNEKVTATAAVLNSLKGVSYNAYSLKEGEQIPAMDLLYLILLASSNEAASIAAEYYGGGSISNFVKMMNEKAAELGMTNTNYVNETGFQSTQQYTTVKDTFILTKYAMSLDAFKEVVGTRLYEMSATNSYSKTRYILTSNWLRDSSTDYYYKYCTGVKTGVTDENARHLVATATKDKKTYVCILMNSPGYDENGKEARFEFTDAKNLLEWAFNDFTHKTVLSATAPVGEAKVLYSWDTDYVSLYPADEMSATIPSSADTSTIATEVHLNQEAFEAPVTAGDTMGYVSVMYAGVELGKVDIVAGDSVERSFWLAALGQIKKALNTIWFKIIIGAVILFIIIRIIASSVKRKKRRDKRKVRNYRSM